MANWIKLVPAVEGMPMVSYKAGKGIKISGNTISAYTDDITVGTNPAGELESYGGGGGGTTNYNALANKPSINGVILQGNQSAAALGLATKAGLDATDAKATDAKNVADAIWSVRFL